MNLRFILVQVKLSEIGSHPSADELVKHDPYGLYMAIMAISLVMFILSFIYLAFKFLTKLINRNSKTISGQSNAENSIKMKMQDMPSGEVSAAIGYALHLYIKELNSEDNTTMTIKRIVHRYSPWNSKIHTLQRYPGQTN